MEHLQTPDAANLLARCSLTRYAIYQDGLDLEIVFTSQKPSIIPGFLRNKRLWPEFWEFTQPGTEGDPAGKTLRFQWIPE